MQICWVENFALLRQVALNEELNLAHVALEFRVELIVGHQEGEQELVLLEEGL